ncbi:hypothetical protein [Novosphingobium sp. P6W]|uniref:hypothetical protein n=1 Tax=Novosphingobium sp. P6W TaxID=1609758 RepID=UPI0005C2CCFC|nr:hypothetical protein [Novosphingobium sp. P6W]AXB80740.1 hypothetical protein TQ38_028965 [Novosphingobium sp. P6W]KIS29593.1 hypothetical protein TQ38_27990 [Novosphingobium sp. P6W]
MKVGSEQEKLHHDLKNVGLRAQATAAGLVQLCKELQGAGVLSEAAVQRIKNSIADEIALTAPRPMLRADFRKEVCQRLDGIFSGSEKLGPAEEMPFTQTRSE